MDCFRDGFERGKLLDHRFLTGSPLNHGSFGMVFTAKDTWTGNDVAIKCITKSDAVKNMSCPAAIATDDRSEELAIHSRLDVHTNIVNLIHHFETAAHQYMVLELCANGDLYEAIRVGRGPLETEHVRDFMLQLVNAIDYLHARGVYHRDIKPENIFLTSAGTMKLGDFGLATTETWSTEFAVGSDRYMAPEQYDASVYGYGYSPGSADIWAIGIVMLNVLFQRNPFASPTVKDPLFADFARDRQSLFDVFPNMSQDTYNVLVHSLALDPANRSLAAVREALKAALSFTTDDESLDDFCNNEDERVPMATAEREPLRTPSVTSPNMKADSYPWTNALKTPQKATRQLSTIRDDEPELFPGSVKSSEWHYVDADEASLSSNVDSGLGLSYKSAKSSTLSRPAAGVAGSLPISFSRPNNTSPSGGFSKSWSDLWDEEEERQQQAEQDGISALDLGMDIDRVETVKPSTPQLRTIVEDDRGSATPRQVLAVADPNTRSVSPLRKLIEHDKAHPESPKQRSSSILDKWAALGNFRRAKDSPLSSSVTPTATPQPQKTKYADAFANMPVFGSNKKAKPPPAQAQSHSQSRSRDRSSSWRQGGSPDRLYSTSLNNSKVWDRNTKDHPSSTANMPLVSAGATATTPVTMPGASWQLDNDWRKHKIPPHQAMKPTSAIAVSMPHNSSAARAVPQPTSDFLDRELADDIGDLDFDVEWAAGWHDQL